uniref:Uncharacterized protein n=1 Tax=Triticum urartu TaxID=4572 RepID=A0A8R7TK50_TRIUA
MYFFFPEWLKFVTQPLSIYFVLTRSHFMIHSMNYIMYNSLCSEIVVVGQLQYKFSHVTKLTHFSILPSRRSSLTTHSCSRRPLSPSPLFCHHLDHLAGHHLTHLAGHPPHRPGGHHLSSSPPSFFRLHSHPSSTRTPP